MSNNIEDFYVSHAIDLKFLPSNVNFKMTRINDTTVEFKIFNQSIDLNKNFKSDKKITKKVRVILPNSPFLDMKKYAPILEMILTQAQGLANKKNHDFTDKDLRKITIKGKKTGLHWKLVDKEHTFCQKILSFLSWLGIIKFVHRRKKNGIIELNLKEFIPWHQKILNLFNKRKRNLIKNFKNFQKIPKINLSESQLNQDKNFDAYTKIATHAYKYLEKDFEGHDYQDINHISSNFIFIYKNQELTLINKEKMSADNIEACLSAVSHYRAQLLKEYGKEKIDYILHLARIDLDKLEKLTPEHIHRINVLSCNIEQQDIQLLLQKMQFIKRYLKEKTNENLLESLNLVNPGILSQNEIKAIIKWVKAKCNIQDESQITIKNFTDSLETLSLKKNFYYAFSMMKTIIANDHNHPKGSLFDYINSNSLIKNIFNNEEELNDFTSNLKYFISKVENGDLIENFPKLFKAVLLIKNTGHFEIEENSTLAIVDPNATFNLKYFIENFNSDLENLTLEETNFLIHAIFPSDIEQKKAYTGRGISYPIESFYTQGGRKFYKPWKDQEEASHTFTILNNDLQFNPYENKEVPLIQKLKERRFDELATHILCKKHLFRSHPDEGYRVGALIPAVSTEDGTKRWYYVDRMIANDQGLLFYVLEPMGNNNHLPTYILPRSTASDTYAYKGLESFRNDLNPLNAPGYEGRRHLQNHMEKVRKEHTIPLWVGYVHSAELELTLTNSDCQKVHTQLTHAKEILIKECLKKYQPKSLHEIVREFDSEINDFVWYNSTLGDLAKRWLTPLKTERSKYENIITHFANNYSKDSLENESENEKIARINKEREDSKFIIEYINKFGQKNEEGKLSVRHQELIKALEDNIQNPKILQSSKILEEAFPEEVLIAFERIENKDMSLNNLNQAKDLLNNYAKSIGEDVFSKKTNGFVVAGHSLGGSTAQVEAYFTTLGSNRIPVPHTKMKVSLYDDPGMNDEDNVDFYKKIFQHQNLMKELNSTIEVYHSHDYGDVIPMGAPAHLGGINKKVTQALYKLCENMILEDEKTEEKPITQSFRKTKNDPNNQLFQEKSLLEIFQSGDQGKNEILSFFLHNFNDVLKVNIELKNTSRRALEPETADINYKHGTRFETSKIEKTTPLKVALEAKKRIACKKEKVNFRVLGSYILENKNKFEPHEDLESFINVFTCYENIRRYLNKVGKITNIKDFLPPEYNYSYLKYFEVKDLSRLKNRLLKEYKELLSNAEKSYFILLENEIENTINASMGGVKLTYLDPFILGSLGGNGVLTHQQCRTIWGGGAIDHKRLKKIAKLLVNLGPFIFPSIASAKSRKEYSLNNGHGKSLDYEDPNYSTLVVDSTLGVL